jgi:serine/threonine protein phosphatase 1
MQRHSTGSERIYAIGDIHGRSDLLALVLARIEADLARRPHPAARIVLLGDYVDRGPDTAGVIERLIALEAGPVAATFLLGNHDHYLLAYLEDPEWSDRGFHWFHDAMGGAATLASYGIHDVSARAPRRSHDAFRAVFPESHRAFLHRCLLSARAGDYLFVHAGIRPGRPIEQQEREDLLWIRDPFLSSREDHGVKVVHGHTIVPFVEHHPNRIAIDTGAVRTGRLSCLLLEAETVSLLTSSGPVPLPEGAGLGLDRLQRRLADGMARMFPRLALRKARPQGS